MLGVVVAWTIAFFFSNLFTCYPITPLVEAFYNNNCLQGVPMWLSAIVTDIVIDIAILTMPIPMVFRLQLPWLQKFGVLCMFMLGATCVSEDD